MKAKRSLLFAALVAVAVGGVLVNALHAQVTTGKSQTILRAGSQHSNKGSADYFTGNVRVDPLFPASDSMGVSGGSVTFEPAARSAWHTHPAGQHLIVTWGVGWIQAWGGPVVEVRSN